MIVVEDDSGLSYAVHRADVREVDHPGNVVATVGGGVAAYGVLNIAFELDVCRDDGNFMNNTEQSAYCVGVFTPAVVGAAMLVWGLIVHQRSAGAAKDTSLPPSTTHVLPNPYQWEYPPDYGPRPGPYPTQPTAPPPAAAPVVPPPPTTAPAAVDQSPGVAPPAPAPPPAPPAAASPAAPAVE